MTLGINGLCQLRLRQLSIPVMRIWYLAALGIAADCNGWAVGRFLKSCTCFCCRIQEIGHFFRAEMMCMRFVQLCDWNHNLSLTCEFVKCLETSWLWICKLPNYGFSLYNGLVEICTSPLVKFLVLHHFELLLDFLCKYPEYFFLCGMCRISIHDIKISRAVWSRMDKCLLKLWSSQIPHSMNKGTLFFPVVSRSEASSMLYFISLLAR